MHEHSLSGFVYYLAANRYYPSHTRVGRGGGRRHRSPCKDSTVGVVANLPVLDQAIMTTVTLSIWLPLRGR